MKNIKKINILGTLFLVIISFSCNDFLTEDDPSNLTIENYFTKPSHAESAISAIYHDLRTIHNNQTWLMIEFQTGIANTRFVGGGGSPDNTIVRNLQNTSDNPSLVTHWTSHYRGIANANVAIANIPKIPMNEAHKNRLIGQARFLRAFYYFNLVRIFGDVPLITESVNLASESLFPTRSPIEQIYNLIVEDLKAAENSGLPITDVSGRVCLGAVKSLLSSVYLTMAGFPLQKGAEYYELAKNKSLEVIQSNAFYLFEDYNDLHNPAMENRGEHIFMIQFNEFDAPSTSLQAGLVPFGLNVSRISSEIGLIFAEQDFISAYKPGDKRTKEGEFFFTKFSSDANRSQTIQFGDHYIYKLMDLNAHLNTGRSGKNWPQMRFAELLLIYAEAINETSGPVVEALEAVNRVRRRADLPDLTGLNRDELREEIWKEKWFELCYEGKVWFDMVRIRKAFNLKSKNFEDYVGHTFVHGPTLRERELLYPIPSQEIRNNVNLTQNPGY